MTKNKIEQRETKKFIRSNKIESCHTSALLKYDKCSLNTRQQRRCTYKAVQYSKVHLD